MADADHSEMPPKSSTLRKSVEKPSLEPTSDPLKCEPPDPELLKKLKFGKNVRFNSFP